MVVLIVPTEVHIQLLVASLLALEDTYSIRGANLRRDVAACCSPFVRSSGCRCTAAVPGRCEPLAPAKLLSLMQACVSMCTAAGAQLRGTSCSSRRCRSMPEQPASADQVIKTISCSEERASY